jgi:hypothetical protein
MGRMYTFVRGRQLEGTYPGSPETGMWIVTPMRILKGWGRPREEDWPYNGKAEDWPPTAEPPGIDQMAARNRLAAYQRIRCIDDCKRALQARETMSTSFSITTQWSYAPGGVIQFPAFEYKTLGSHAVGIVGYDDVKEHLIFRNSWGINWGDHGRGYMPYGFFQAELNDGWSTLHKRKLREDKPPELTLREVDWATEDNRGSIIHVRETIDPLIDRNVAWAFAVERDGFVDVEELFVMPEYRKMGHACRLVWRLEQLMRQLKRPIRFWIPHADASDGNMKVVRKIIGKLGLNLQLSGTRWAAYVADSGATSLSLEPYAARSPPGNVNNPDGWHMIAGDTSSESFWERIPRIQIPRLK